MEKEKLPAMGVVGEGILDDRAVFGKSIIDCSNMFNNNSTFNKPVIMLNGVTNCAYMFNYANNFNQPIIIPNSVTNCQGMFSRATKFNQPVIIGDKVSDCSSMFFGAGFNQPVIIGNKVSNCYGMFSDIQDMSSNIYIRRISTVNMVNLISNRNTAKRINLFCNNISILNQTTPTTSLTGTVITWTATTNGYYNTAYNIYIYNNCPY